MTVLLSAHVVQEPGSYHQPASYFLSKRPILERPHPHRALRYSKVCRSGRIIVSVATRAEQGKADYPRNDTQAVPGIGVAVLPKRLQPIAYRRALRAILGSISKGPHLETPVRQSILQPVSKGEVLDGPVVLRDDALTRGGLADELADDRHDKHATGVLERLGLGGVGGTKGSRDPYKFACDTEFRNTRR